MTRGSETSGSSVDEDAQPPGGAEDQELEIAVVGSIHQDVILEVGRLPGPGETILALGHSRGPGGKGANQAIAARRLGGSVALVGQVGRDADGQELRERLTGEGVDVRHVETHATLPSGLAIVAVDSEGENSIIVHTGASGAVSQELIRAAASTTIRRSRVTLLQLEIDLKIVSLAAKMASGIVILNPAPATEVPRDLISLADVLVPNAIELAMMAGRDAPFESLVDVERAAIELSTGNHIVVTLGRHGALLVSGSESTHFPAPNLVPTDTTGAGDAFCGALALGLARHQPLHEVVARAVQIASISTTRLGAQTVSAADG